MNRSVFKLLVLANLILFVGCVSKKIVVDETTNEALQPKLIFLNYSISKDENNKKSIQFISKIVADGKLKTNSNKYIKTGSLGDLKCSQLNKNSVEVASIIIKNPLSKNIEFVNDSLIFENKKIDLNKAFFSVRLQLHSKTAFIAIKEIKDSVQNANTLNIIKVD